MDASPGKQAAKQAYGNIIVGFALLCICILASSVSGEGRGGLPVGEVGHHVCACGLLCGFLSSPLPLR